MGGAEGKLVGLFVAGVKVGFFVGDGKTTLSDGVVLSSPNTDKGVTAASTGNFVAGLQILFGSQGTLICHEQDAHRTVPMPPGLWHKWSLSPSEMHG